MGQDGSGQLTLDQFAMFVRLLQREALVMQFNQCDARGQGLLTSTDFAKFLVTKVMQSKVACRMEKFGIYDISYRTSFCPPSPVIAVCFMLLQNEKIDMIKYRNNIEIISRRFLVC